MYWETQIKRLKSMTNAYLNKLIDEGESLTASEAMQKYAWYARAERASRIGK